MLFSGVIDELLEDVAPAKREATQYRYGMYLGEIGRDLGTRKLSTFSRKDFMVWVKHLRRAHPKRNTFNDYSKFMNIIFNFSYQQKYITHLIKFPTVDGERERAGRVYKAEELEALVEALDDVTLIQFILSYECFMRLREVLHLTWDRVDFDNRNIILRKQDVKTGSKCGEGREIPMSDNAYEMLKDLKNRATTPWVFPNPKKIKYLDSNKKKWNNAKKKAGIKGRARWHDIRHTALTHAILVKKLSVAHVSMVAGVSIRTLQKVYLHRDVEHLRFVTKNMKLKIA